MQARQKIYYNFKIWIMVWRYLADFINKLSYTFKMVSNFM